MRKRTRKLIADIELAAAAVQIFMAGKSRDDLHTDLLLRSAVERQLELIGEAVRQLHANSPRLAEQISEHHRIIDFRNVLAHGYDLLDEAIIWQMLTDKLPILLDEVHALKRRA